MLCLNQKDTKSTKNLTVIVKFTQKNFLSSIISHTNGKTEVIWTSQYTCDLGPKWYFQPIEDYTIEIMNEHLINSYFN